MTERRLKLLTLMARQAQVEIGQMSLRLNQLRQTELQHFDMTDRLNAILADTHGGAGRGAITRGELGTSQFMQQAVMTQLEALRQQAEAAQIERRALEAELGQHSQRRAVLTDRADATRQSLAQLKSEL